VSSVPQASTFLPFKQKGEQMKKEDKDTRYYIDLDIEARKIIGWDYGQRYELIEEELPEGQVRIYITRGQFKKLGERK